MSNRKDPLPPQLERFLQTRRLDQAWPEAQDRNPASHGLWKLFGNLRIRAKLVVLHNLFFLVLTLAVYWSVIPPFEKRVAAARAREVALLYERLPADSALAPGSERPPRVPDLAYNDLVARAKGTLFLVLGVIYVLAVALLEISIMPRYVYQPLSLMLRADRATQSGNRGREMIPDRLIPGDEIGQIMRSRNLTVAELRRHQDELAAALHQLEIVAADLQRKNEQLETARRNLMDQDRLASLGLLSASVAHEMNTPLAVLRGSLEKLAETIEDRAAQQRLARMLRVTERLRAISASLLDFARVGPPEMGRVELRGLLEEAWHLVAFEERAAEVHFANEVPAEHACVGNAGRLGQVFVNLLRNALDAVGAGGHVWVRSREVMRGGARSIAVAVEDDGPGIPPEALPDIFDAFVTTRLDARGTGLGLTVAEGIIHQHGGTLSASNRAQGGASLEVVLRRAE